MIKQFSVAIVSLGTAESGTNYTENQESSAESSCHSSTASSLESQEHGRNGHNAHDSWEHAHSHIWHVRLQVILSNVLEVEISIESSQPSSKCN